MIRKDQTRIEGRKLIYLLQEDFIKAENFKHAL